MTSEIVFNIEGFKSVKFLGSGTFGQVFKYSSSALGAQPGKINEVAVKKLPVPAEKFDASRDCREIILSLQLKHDNIVRFFGYCIIDLQVALVMELCKGDLQNLIDSPKILDEDEVGFLANQICQGLAFLHKQTIIHRDIKPHNILLQYGSSGVDVDSINVNDLVLKITDFGLSRQLKEDATSATMTVVGTPLYAAPELRNAQSRMAHYSMRADVYSLGLVVYHLLKKDLHKLVAGIEGIGALILSRQWLSSRDFRNFLAACLQYQPEKRSDAVQLLEHPVISGKAAALRLERKHLFESLRELSLWSWEDNDRLREATLLGLPFRHKYLYLDPCPVCAVISSPWDTPKISLIRQELLVARDRIIGEVIVDRNELAKAERLVVTLKGRAKRWAETISCKLLEVPFANLDGVIKDMKTGQARVLMQHVKFNGWRLTNVNEILYDGTELRARQGFVFARRDDDSDVVTLVHITHALDARVSTFMLPQGTYLSRTSLKLLLSETYLPHQLLSALREKDIIQEIPYVGEVPPPQTNAESCLLS